MIFPQYRISEQVLKYQNLKKIFPDLEVIFTMRPFEKIEQSCSQKNFNKKIVFDIILIITNISIF